MDQKNSDRRPAIWAEGSQKPQFDLRLFGQATLALARQGIFGLLQRSAAGTGAFGARLAAGDWRIPAHRLGRTGRFLPTSERTGAAMCAGADVMSRAANVVLPTAPDKGAELLPQTRVTAAYAKPLPQVQPRRVARYGSEGDELHRIRAMMLAQDEPALAVPAAPGKDAATTAGSGVQAPQPGRIGQLVRNTLAHGLGYGLLGLSLPYGAARATLWHLSGGDLRELG